MCVCVCVCVCVPVFVCMLSLTESLSGVLLLPGRSSPGYSPDRTRHAQ